MQLLFSSANKTDNAVDFFKFSNSKSIWEAIFAVSSSNGSTYSKKFNDFYGKYLTK